jgi:glycosyltransferase involved in cell wall biosynthesis
MTIFLLAENSDQPSGGHVFNQRLLSACKEMDCPVTPIYVTPGQLAVVLSSNEFLSLLRISNSQVVVDSIFWEELANLKCMPGRCHILVHFLPSENPRLTGNERGYWKSVETRVIRESVGLIVVGRLLMARLRTAFPTLCISLCEPGFSLEADLNSLSTVNSTKSARILTVANVMPTKGFSDLVGVLATLKGWDWRWTIVGSMDFDRAYYEGICRGLVSHGLEDRVIFKGILTGSSLFEEYNNHDIFLFGSHFESFGMAVSDAVSLDLSVVSTEVGEMTAFSKIRERIWHSEVGDTSRMREHLIEAMEGLNSVPRRMPLQLSGLRKWSAVAADFLNAVQLA